MTLVFLVCASAAHAQTAPSPDVPSEQNLTGTRQSCSATNDKRDQRCSISCEPGQTADCEDGEDFDVPVCQCEK